MDGAAGEIFSFRLQRASFLSFWEHFRQEMGSLANLVRYTIEFDQIGKKKAHIVGRPS